MQFGRLMVILCLLSIPVLSAVAAQTDWMEVGSEHFVLYTDTGAEKGLRLLGDLEARHAAFSRAFGSSQPRSFRIRVFLMDSREEFTESVPDSVLKTIGTGVGGRRGRLVANESGYLILSPTGTFLLARDQDPSDIADDVAHSLGHLLLGRTTLWQPFWLQEGVGEYLRRLGRGKRDQAVSREDGFSVPEILSIVPSETYDDLDGSGAFRTQSYHLLRVMMESFPAELESFLQALREDSGSEARPAVPVDALEDLIFSYVETSLPLNGEVIATDARGIPVAEFAASRGDLLLGVGRPREAAVLYNDNPTEAARIGEIHEFIMRTSRGYDTKLGEDGIKLSVGEKQRLAIARAVLTDPAILILDEATSSLDSLSEALIQKAMANVMEGRTAFVIAHRLSTIISADVIVVMDHGEIKEVGTHAELVEKPDGMYRQLYEQQYAGFEGVEAAG